MENNNEDVAHEATITEAIKLHPDLKRPTLMDWIKKGKLPAKKREGSKRGEYLIDVNALKKLLEARSSSSKAVSNTSSADQNGRKKKALDSEEDNQGFDQPLGLPNKDFVSNRKPSARKATPGTSFKHAKNSMRKFGPLELLRMKHWIEVRLARAEPAPVCNDEKRKVSTI